MSLSDWIGYFGAVVICLGGGWWMHRINNTHDDTRVEDLATAFGVFGLAVVLAVKAINYFFPQLPGA